MHYEGKLKLRSHNIYMLLLNRCDHYSRFDCDWNIFENDRKHPKYSS